MRIEFAAGLLGPRLFQRTLTFCAAMGVAVFCGANGIVAPFGSFASPPQIDYFAHLSTRAAALRCGVLIPSFARPCGVLQCEPGKSKVRWQVYDSSAVFELEVSQ
jgi:hypothetical protein